MSATALTSRGTRRARWVLAAALVLGPLLAAAGAPEPEDSLELLPPRFTLRGPAARQTLLLEVRRGAAHVGEFRGPALEALDPGIVRVEDGVAIPVASGRTSIVGRGADGKELARAEVEVTGLDETFAWSFRHHVQPVLSRSGCNGGACHGAFAGKNGFLLSLRGYNADGDYLAITRHARGRRVELRDPARSLVLLKPTGAVPHKGGARFDTGSLEYRILSEWLAAGAPGPLAKERRLSFVELIPRRCVLEPGMEQRLLALAHFDDGSVEDVTYWAKFTATNAAVATVDERGLVRITGRGEGAISVWYASQIATAAMSAPFAPAANEADFAPFTPRNFVDEIVLAKLRALGLPPSPPASDGEFLRRAFLDTIGVLPAAAEARAFLADPSTDKRERLVDSLLERPEYVDYWAYKWSDLLLVSSEKLRPSAMWSYYSWIRDQVAASTPWDEMARRLLVARGSTLENGATNFYLLHPDPREMAETVSVAFLGMSIQCAKCHNHPLEKWTNDQFYGMASLFARVRSKSLPTDGNHLVFSATSGELVQPLTGRPQPPRPLDGVALPADFVEDRRAHLAAWLTSAENPYFGRAIANRIWANFFGTGIVEPVDDLRLTNPPSNPELLEALAQFLRQSRYDLKALLRAILGSATYQRSSTPLPGNTGDSRFYSRFYPRRLAAEVLLDALSQVAGAPTEFPGYPSGWRALQLPDANVASYFLKSFGRPDRAVTCECARSEEPSMTQALHLANGETLNKKLALAENRIGKLLAAGAGDSEIIDELFLGALSRAPSAEERRVVLEQLGSAAPAARREAIEDLFWSVLSATEFLFTH